MLKDTISLMPLNNCTNPVLPGRRPNTAREGGIDGSLPRPPNPVIPGSARAVPMSGVPPPSPNRLHTNLTHDGTLPVAHIPRYTLPATPLRLI
jgi:hypothetical protein